MEADSKVAKDSDIGFWKSLMLGGIVGAVVNMTQPTGAATEYLTYALIVILILMLIRPKNKFLQTRKSYGGLFAGVLVFMFISSGQKLGQQLHQSAATSTVNMVADAPRIAAESHEYTDKDFYWDKNTTPWKAVIIKGVNKIHRENSRCTNLDPGSVDVSLSKGTKSNPVFYVTCQPPGEASFNVFFSKADVEDDKTLSAANHIDLTTAKRLCEDYAKTQAQNPQTIKFSWVVDMGVKEYPNGRTRINSSFKASNLMGVEQSFNITCLFDDKSFIEGAVTDR